MYSNLSLFCPYCREATAASTAPLSFIDDYQQPHTHSGKPVFYDGAGAHWWIGRCNACQSPLLIANQARKVYPVPQPSPTSKEIPDPMRRDFNEAKVCHAAGAFFAAATMARRALQGACLSKGADPEHKLEVQIDWLCEERVITNDIRAWAHTIRFVGNDGAHPSKDEVDTARPDAITVEDATAIISLVDTFFTVLYVAPALMAAQIAKTGKVVPAPKPIPLTGKDRQ